LDMSYYIALMTICEDEMSPFLQRLSWYSFSERDPPPPHPRSLAYDENDTMSMCCLCTGPGTRTVAATKSSSTRYSKLVTPPPPPPCIFSNWW
jgi:hypothetical protein